MAEVIDNAVSQGTKTLLQSGIAATDLTIPVQDFASTTLQGGQFRVMLIDPTTGNTELALVTGGQNTLRWNIQRGVEGTTPRAFPASSIVKHVITSQGLANYIYSSGGILSLDPLGRQNMGSLRDLPSIIDYGAVGDGTNHFVSELFTTLSLAQAFYGLNADGSQVCTSLTTNQRDRCAAQLVANLALRVTWPRGTYLWEIMVTIGNGTSAARSTTFGHAWYGVGGQGNVGGEPSPNEAPVWIQYTGPAGNTAEVDTLALTGTGLGGSVVAQWAWRNVTWRSAPITPGASAAAVLTAMQNATCGNAINPATPTQHIVTNAAIVNSSAGITSIPVAALPVAIPAGPVTLLCKDSSNLMPVRQTFQTPGAAIGATSIPVNQSGGANVVSYPFPAGSVVLLGTPTVAGITSLGLSSGGGAITTINASPLVAALPAGTFQIIAVPPSSTGGTTPAAGVCQTFTATAEASLGTGTITVSSQTPSASFPAGSLIVTTSLAGGVPGYIASSAGGPLGTSPVTINFHGMAGPNSGLRLDTTNLTGTPGTTTFTQTTPGVAPSAVMCHVAGPIHSAVLSGFMFDCNHKAATGLRFDHTMDCEFENLRVVKYLTLGIAGPYAYAAPSGTNNGANENTFHEVAAILPSTSGLVVDGWEMGNGDGNLISVSSNTLTACRAYRSSTVFSDGLRLQHADSNEFEFFSSWAAGSSSALGNALNCKVPAPTTGTGDLLFPNVNNFSNSPMSGSIQVTRDNGDWTSSYTTFGVPARITFWPFYDGGGAPPPPHPNFIGVTNAGIFFGFFAPPIASRTVYTGTHTISARGDNFIACKFTAAGALTLPQINATQAGKLFYVVDENNNAGTNPITLQRTGTDTWYDGSTSKVINTNGGAAVFYTDGVSWRLISLTPATPAIQTYTNAGTGTTTVNAANGTFHQISLTGTGAWTLGSPSNDPSATNYQDLIIEVINNSGAVSGTATLGAFFKLGGLANPFSALAIGKRGILRAAWDGSAWVAISVNTGI